MSDANTCTVTPDPGQARQFIERMFADDEVFEFRGFASDKTRSGLTYNKWFTRAEFPELNGELANPLFVGINPRTDHGMAGDSNVRHCRFVFADFDPPEGEAVTVDEALKTITDAGLPYPDPIVASGRGVHAYWQLAEPIDGAAFRSIQDRLAALLGSDPVVKNPERIMRVPGSIHDKGEPVLVELVSCIDERYHLSHIEKHLPDAKPEAPPAEPLVEGERRPLPNRIAGIVVNGVDKGREGVPGRNNAAFEIAANLAGNGWDQEDARRHVQTFASNCRPPLDRGEAEACLQSAYSKPRQPTRSTAATEVGSAWQLNGSTPATEAAAPRAKLPMVALPEDDTTFIEAGQKLGDLLAKKQFYARGADRRFARIRGREIELIKPSQARSVFEQVAMLGVRKFQQNAFVFKQKRCSKEAAEGIIEADSFRDALPHIDAISHCPVLLEDGTVVTGYHEPAALYAFGEPPAEVEFEEAKRLLLGLHEDFNYVTEHDHARAVAATLTPALTYGRLLGPARRCPSTAREADQSQAGKGVGNRIDAAIYGTLPAAVGQRTGGVGSIEESIQKLLIAATPFITLDNIRGRVSLPWLEMALTEPAVDCRVPHKGSVTVDPSRTAWSITSNKAEMTPDLANRCNIVRIEKQPEGYEFKSFPEGDVVDHVRANQPLYLGAVYAVVKAWLAAGRPGEPDGRHDFRHWAGAVRWMVQDLLGLADPLSGHRELQLRTANASANWMRDVALAVAAAGRLDESLAAHDLLDILVEAEVEVPGVKQHDDPDDDRVRANGLRGIGRRMKSVFKKLDSPNAPLSVDAFEVSHTTHPHPEIAGRLTHLYQFAKATG